MLRLPRQEAMDALAYMWIGIVYWPTRSRYVHKAVCHGIDIIAFFLLQFIIAFKIWYRKVNWHKFDSAISRLSIYTVNAYVFLLIKVLFHMHIPLYTVISYSLNGQATNLQCACETVYTCNVYATLYFKALHWGLWLRLCRKHFVIIQICFIYIS